MAAQYAFIYFMNRNSPDIPKLIPEHIKYWEKYQPADYAGGPFSDQSGGLILFKVANMEMAKALVENDPFVVGNVIEERWIKEWMQK